MARERAHRLVGFLLEEARTRMPAATTQQLAWAIDQYTDAELLQYVELDRAAVRELRRWAATWRDVEVRL